MKTQSLLDRRFECCGLLLLLALAAFEPTARASAPGSASSSVNLGPYNVTVLEGGIGMQRPLAANTALLAADAAWSITGWLRSTRRQPGAVIVAAVGDVDTARPAWRGVLLVDGELALRANPTLTLRSRTILEPGQWYAIAATYDGTTARLYVDGRERASAAAATLPVVPRIELAPPQGKGGAAAHFGGTLAQLTLAPTALGAQAVRSLAAARPDFSLVTFNALGVGWPLQEHAWRGLQEPQDPWTLPKGKSAPTAPVAAPVPPTIGGLRSHDPGLWTLEEWHLRAAPQVIADGAQLSQADYPERQWIAAVVPGTVLTTLIARGVYPDPDYGLNNLAIPDTLSRQDYWYRSVFFAPATLRDRELTLTFKGINYAAEVWLNGQRLGDIRGAFTRGIFNVTGVLQPGQRNGVAVRISPPPHPGIPHEQSIAAGPGENGGELALDGPTFIATEGWDWIPGIRDRNAGLWQGVELSATGALRLVDPHVVTRLPLPRTDSADIAISVAVENRRALPIQAALIARIDSISVRKSVTLPPGTTIVALDPREFAQLHLTDPKLWWPNGYGPANLYKLELEIDEGDTPSDAATVKFGIRELTYELSLFDHDGRLRRVEVDPTLGTLLGERLVDVRHEAIKRTSQGWAASLTAAGEASPAVQSVSSESLTPFLVIRVNGVPIAARGGSWGMDDSRKRISRARLEPFFQLHRDANLNIIRNWLGQNTEEVFYELADEYGLLVLNDFWVSTQDFQLEAQDPALFLANARDVISRYRNHPSIAVWFGRNEGVPQPIINEGLADLVATLDGTRYYTGSSNSVNLQGSGPYNYRPPEQYFTGLARGFSVEVGTPSLSTLEALRASIPAADRWPLSDTYAYHDWHFGGNGDVATFMAAMAEQYGVAGSLEDFERKAQLMDYVSYRAIFEGFQAHLWTENSGRLLWMTHPSWPSNTWQIYSSDYDTAAAYYAVKKACEPVHAQLDLPDYRLAVVNTTRSDRPGLRLRSRVLSLDDRLLAERVDAVDAASNSVVTLPAPLDLPTVLAQEGLVLVKLTLTDKSGATVSDNVYWPGRDAASQQRLNGLRAQPITLSARGRADASGALIDISLANHGNAPVLNAKLTVLDDRRERVLPVFYEDNYLTLLPGEVRHISVRCPSAGAHCARVSLRGWNVDEQQIAVNAW
jgi:beta-galactosidase/beta-glucuronidase